MLGERTRGERAGRFLIRLAGRPRSVLLHGIFFASWIVWNCGWWTGLRTFDPYPFSLLALFAGLEAILLGLLILTSQNRLQQEADRRAHLNLQINMLAEVEGTKVVQMLDRLSRHFGLETEAEELINELKAETDPEKIVETIRSSIPTEE